MTDPTLVNLVQWTRGKLLKTLADVDEAQARFAAPQTRNTILWHAGHASVLAEMLFLAALQARAPQFRDGWFDTFGWGSKPEQVTSWPAFADVRALLQQQFEQMTALAGAATPDLLSRPFEGMDFMRGKPLRDVAGYGLFDEAQHLGEIHLLKKLYARGAR